MENETIDNNIEKSDENQTVGDILRRARLKQGKTLNDVAADLCIRRMYLEAIENVEYNKLPVEPYGLGYVRNYAEYLGLNSARIAQSFKETAIPKINGKKKLKAIGDEIENTGPSVKHIVVGFVLMFAALLGWNFYSQYTKGPSVEIVNDTPVAENYPTPVILEEDEIETEIEDENEATNVVSNEAETNVQAESMETENTEVLSEGAENIDESSQKEVLAEPEKVVADENAPRIKIVVLEDSWIELKHGDEVLLAKVYGKGFEYVVPYNENLEVSVGKRANVEFYIDGKLTEVTTPRKQMRIKLDKFLE